MVTYTKAANVLAPHRYMMIRAQTAEIRKAWQNSLSKAELTKFEHFRDNQLQLPRIKPDHPEFDDRVAKFFAEVEERKMVVRSLMTEMVHAKHPEMRKDGVTTTTGFNFYDLRPAVRLLYPVNVPFRNSLPRVGKVNAGVGTVAHWQGTRNPGTPYAGASEGNRVAVGTPDDIPYLALYKEIGVERSVTYTAQFAGEGYADNLADEHIRGLHSLWLQEEGIILMGNSGVSTGTNGFQLATAPTPTTSLVATNLAGSLPYTTAFTTSNYVSVAVVCLTALGNPVNSQYGYGVSPTATNGLTTSYIRNNADGSTDKIYGGMSAISAISVTPLQCTSGNLTVKAIIPTASLPVKGCFGYAWFVDVETSSTGSLANAKLAGITTNPSVLLSGTAIGTQAGNASGLNVDNSAQPLDFDGLLTYAAKTGGWTDLYGASLTSQKNGRVTEIETILFNIFQQFQTQPDEMWCSADAALNLDAAIRYNGTTAPGFQFMYTRDSQNNLMGGFVVSGYQSRYAVNSPIGGNVIPIKIHPMLPAGTIYFHLKTNPWPHSRVDFVCGLMMQRDYYSIEWPQTSRVWPFGTYCHECLAMEMPFIPAVLTGISTFVGS